MFYKLVAGGQIVDVCEHLSLVRWQRKNGLFLCCDTEEDATGIISSDGSTIYLLDGAEQVGELEYAHYAEIAEEDYISLREQLIANGVLDDNENRTDIDIEPEGNPTHEPVKKSEAMKKIEELQEQVNFLTDCLMEMSEAVYA